MTASPDARQLRTTHVWAPFQDTFVYVELPVGTDAPPDPGRLLADATTRSGPIRDDSYSRPLWRVAATDLHAVVEALWSSEGPVHIHLDQAPPTDVPRHGSGFDSTLVVRSRRAEADGVVSLELGPRAGESLPPWQPGAHVDVVLPTGITRQYSLCGPPSDTNRWRIAVLREPDGRGGSRWIHDNVREGVELRVRGPRNNFPLRPADRYLFVAGGIGITPLLPMIAAAEAQGADWSLLYGGRTSASMAFLPELASHGERVTVRPQDRFGHLDLPGFLGGPDLSVLVYCCGPAGLIEAVEAHCATWPTGSLNVERFAVAAGQQPASGEGDQPFEVELRASGMTLTVPAEQTILTAVEQAGIQVLSSCQEGICGSCETPVLEGEVDHRDALLSDEERAAGDTMLICVSRARAGRLVLDL